MVKAKVSISTDGNGEAFAMLAQGAEGQASKLQTGIYANGFDSVRGFGAAGEYLDMESPQAESESHSVSIPADGHCSIHIEDLGVEDYSYELTITITTEDLEQDGY